MKALQLLALSLLCLCMHAQNEHEFKRDLLAVNRNMGNLNKYSVTMKYAMFVDNKLEKAYSNKQIRINLDNELYNMSEQDRFEVIENKSEYMIIDHRSKTVWLNRLKNDVTVNAMQGEDEGYDEVMDLVEQNYDSLMLLATKITIISNNYPYKTYSVEYNADCEYKKAVYTIDLKNKLFKSITVTYNEPEYVEGLDDNDHIVTMKVDYENFQVNQPLPQSCFDMGKYIEKKSSQTYVLKGALKAYKLQVI